MNLIVFFNCFSINQIKILPGMRRLQHRLNSPHLRNLFPYDPTLSIPTYILSIPLIVLFIPILQTQTVINTTETSMNGVSKLPISNTNHDLDTTEIWYKPNNRENYENKINNFGNIDFLRKNNINRLKRQSNIYVNNKNTLDLSEHGYLNNTFYNLDKNQEVDLHLLRNITSININITDIPRKNIKKIQYLNNDKSNRKRFSTYTSEQRKEESMAKLKIDHETRRKIFHDYSSTFEKNISNVDELKEKDFNETNVNYLFNSNYLNESWTDTYNGSLVESGTDLNEVSNALPTLNTKAPNSPSSSNSFRSTNPVTEGM